MSTKKKDYLNFDRGPNWESPREREWRLQEEAAALALAEEERRKRIEDAARLKAPAPYNPEQEERIRKEKAAASLDSFGSMQGMKQALDTPSPEPAPVEDSGYSIWDVGVSARQGAAAVTKGALGLPVNAANLIAAPFMDNPFQQPEFVRDMRGIIDEQQQDIYDRQASDKLKGKNQEFQKADSLWEVSKFAATNPGWLGLQAFQQGPQVLASGPGGVLQKVLTGAVNAAGQSEEAVATELRKQGLSEEEIAKRSASAFAESFALNSAIPYTTGGTFLEGLANRQLRQRVVDSVGKDVLAKVGKETAESIITEVGDQYIQNIHSGKAADEGLAHAGVLGAFFSLAAAGPTATIQSAAEAGRAASRLQAHILEKRINKPTSEPDNSVSADFLKMTQGELFGEGGKLEPATTATPVEAADAVNQGQLRTKAATIRTQLDKDRSALSALQQRIERAPFAEEAADLLTNQERGDMQRLQARIPIQEQRLAEIESAIVPIQSRLPLGERRQPKNPKFRGDERTVDQVKSDYFKTQPVQGPAPMSPELRKEAQRAKVEELKRTKKEAADADKKAKAQYEAARRKYLDGVRAGLMDLDPNTRASRLAEAAVAWKVDNPLVLPSKQAPTTTTPAQNQTAAPVEGEATVPVSAIDDRLQAAPEAAGALPSVTPRGGTGATLSDVSKAVGGGRRDKLASRLGYMIEDGNLEIVEDQSQLPEGMVEQDDQGRGWYDPNTGKTYIVAGNLDKGNIRGDILSVLAHETKHGGDFGGDNIVSRSFSKFIGAEANKKLGAKIRAAAAAGDAGAKEALDIFSSDAYQKRRLTEDQKASELVAAYITVEGNKTGARTTLYRAVVNPLLTGAKQLVGADLDLKDIHYMADQWVREVASKGERFQPNGSGVALPSILGEQATGFNQAEQQNRVYTSKDGSRRFVISDKAAKVNPSGLAKLVGGGSVKLGDMIDHGELYSNYQNMPNTITVKLAPAGADYGAMAVGNDILVARETAALAMLRPATFKGIMLHEMQHVVQDAEGHSPGGMPENFLGDEARSAIRNGKAKVGGLKLEASALTQPGTLEAVSTEDAAALQSIADGIKKDKIDAFSGMSQATDILSRYSDRNLVKLTERLLNKTEDAMNAWESKTQAEQQAQTDYLNMLGETDARFTENNADLPLDELPINPETSYNANVSVEPNDSPKPPIARRTAPMPNAVEQTEQDNRTGGEKKKDAKPMPSIVSKATPQDRRTMWARIKDANSVIRTISNLVSTTDGHDQQVFELLSERSSDRATLAYEAEQLEADMRDGIKKAAKEQGVSNAVIDEQLDRAVEDINTLPTKEARDLAIKNLDNKYPGVGTALVAIRDLKWRLARAVIVQRRAEGRDLTQKELNVINKMLDREETWTTRVYESGQPNAKKLAKARMARYKKNPNSKEAKQHLDDVEFLRNNYVNIPSKDELLTMKAPGLRNFYETWLGDADGVSEGDMVEALAALPKLEPAILQKKLDKVVRELIGLDKPQTKTVRGFAGSRQNRTVLEGRQNIPPEIRRLMGEITGTVAKEVLSVARLSSLYTQNKVLANLAANYKGILWEDYSVGEFTIPVTAENYGPMRGKFVTPAGSRVLQPIVDLGMNAEEALNTINENGANAIGKGIAAVGGKVQKLAGVTKIVSLILNLGAAGANWAGAWGALTANGVGVNRAVAAHKLTLKAIRARYKPNLYKGSDKKDVRDVILSGVLDSATTGEYQQRLFSTLFRNMEEDASPKDVIFKLYNLWNDGLLTSKDFYAFMDMWAKVGAWADRREMLTKMYEADGVAKSEDDIIREAGHDITAANISWIRAPAIVKATEKYLGPFAMFLVYFAEVPRSTAFSYALVGKDLARANTLETKEAKTLLRDAAIRRLVGTTMYISAIAGGMAVYLNGMDDDEERRRKTDPKWEQKGLNVVVGKTEEGKDISYNLLRMDFIGPLNELLVKLATQDENDTTVGIFKEYVTDQFVKNRALFSLMRSINSLAGNETVNFKESDSELVNRLDQLSWGDDHNLGKNLADTIDKFTPAIVRGTVNTIKGVTGSNDYKFSPSDNPVAAALQASGLKLTVRDPEKSLEFAVTAYNKAKKSAQSDLTATEKQFGRLRGTALINELDDVIEEERKAHKALHEVYDGVTAFNGYYTDKDYAAAARAILKAKKLGPASSDIVSGSFNVRFVSKDYLNKWVTARQEAIKELPTDKKSEASAALRADIKLVKDYLNSRSK